MDRFFLLTVLLSLAILAAIFILIDNKVEIKPTTLILFYGQECPHCAELEKIMDKQQIKDKVDIEEKEVYHNPDNLSEIFKVASSCGISEDSVGVPLLWDGKNCYVGNEEILNFLNKVSK